MVEYNRNRQGARRRQQSTICIGVWPLEGSKVPKG